MKMRLRLMQMNQLMNGSQFYLYQGRRLYTLVTTNKKTDEAIYHSGDRETLLPGQRPRGRYRSPMYTSGRYPRRVWLVVSHGTSAP